MCENIRQPQCIGLIGAEPFGFYGGYETFIDKLTEYHKDYKNIKYYVAVKANGQGSVTPGQKVKRDNTKSNFKMAAHCDYDNVLKHCYGNYMELLPEKDRVENHYYAAYRK